MTNQVKEVILLFNSINDIINYYGGQKHEQTRRSQTISKYVKQVPKKNAREVQPNRISQRIDE